MTEILTDIWILTRENPVTMGTFYAVFALTVTATAILIRRNP